VEVRFRGATVEDADALVALWQQAELRFRVEDVATELTSVLSRDPELVILAEDDDGLVASVFGAYDGRRAWANRLATRPDRRGQGLARELMRRLEESLRAKGCLKLNLLVQNSNAEVIGFYRSMGYVPDDVTFLGKRLTDVQPSPSDGRVAAED
jgi:ribosomal protein S18 acetylase RimI-like enzyme